MAAQSPTEQGCTEMPTGALFAGVVGIDWSGLPHAVRDSHRGSATRAFRGRGEVRRGRGPMAWLVASLCGFPPSVADIEVEVVKSRDGARERWERRFGRHRFASTLRLRDGRLRERFGLFEFELDLHVADQALHFPLRRGWLCGLPLPRWLLPISRAREHGQDERLNFDVALIGPLGMGLLVHYRGWLQPVSANAPQQQD